MRWFGNHWGASVCDATPRASVPVGQSCLQCDEAIQAGDDGLILPYFDSNDTADHRPMHIECYTRSLVGGANHQIGCCTCCGGMLPPDPPGLSKREAAKLAMKIWKERQDGRHKTP